MTAAAPPLTKANRDPGQKRDPLITRILQFYPVTCLTVAPYAAVVIPQAMYYHNPRTGFIVYLVVLAAVGAGAIETLFVLLRPPYRNANDRVTANSRYPRIVRVARAVAIISITADITNAVSGGGSIFTQLTGRAAASPLVALTTPLASWKYLAVALLASACLGELMAKRTFYQWAAALIGTQFLIATYTAITQPAISFISFVALAGLMVGLVRGKVVLVAAAVLLMAWPTIFTIRNEIRASNGVSVSSNDTAQERLRFDEQVARASGYQVPANISGTLTPADILRYGLIPRALDPSRPLLSTGTLINEYMGGSRTSAYTFLPLGTVYFLEGPDRVALFYGAWAFFFVLLLRTGGGPGPGRLVLLLLAITGPLGWTSTYPDSMVAYLQSLVAALPVLGALKVFGSAPKLPGSNRSRRVPPST